MREYLTIISGDTDLYSFMDFVLSEMCRGTRLIEATATFVPDELYNALFFSSLAAWGWTCYIHSRGGKIRLELKRDRENSLTSAFDQIAGQLQGETK